MFKHGLIILCFFTNYINTVLETLSVDYFTLTIFHIYLLDSTDSVWSYRCLKIQEMRKRKRLITFIVRSVKIQMFSKETEINKLKLDTFNPFTLNKLSVSSYIVWSQSNIEPTQH